MNPNSSSAMRYVGAVSIGIAVSGSIVALCLLAGPNYGTMPGIGGYQKIFALAALWITNLMTLLLNAIYFIYWRQLRWLKVLILVQMIVALTALFSLD